MQNQILFSAYMTVSQNNNLQSNKTIKYVKCKNIFTQIPLIDFHGQKMPNCVLMQSQMQSEDHYLGRGNTSSLGRSKLMECLC